MKSGLSWNLSGVDKETREAVIEAARLSGLTVGEWLNQVLGENFAEPELEKPAEPPEDDTDASDVARSIERLSQRLGAMGEASRATITGLPDRLDEIEHHINRLSSIRRTGAERTQSLRGIATMVKDLARDIDNADERARSMVEGLRARNAAAPEPQAPPAAPEIARVNEAIAELDLRIAEMRNRLGAPPSLEARPQKLEEIRRRLDVLLAQAETPVAPPKAPAAPQAAVINAALRALEERIDDAKAQMEARAAAVPPPPPPPPPGPPAATAEQLERVEQRLADIAAQFAASEAERKKPKKEAELASAIREISSHQRAIDDRAETLAMRRDQKALSAAMGALRTDLGGLAEQVSAISRVGVEQHGAFFEVAQRVDTLVNDRPLDRKLLAAIRGELETMRGMVEGGARQATLGAIETRHDLLNARIEELGKLAPELSRLDALGDEISALRRSLESDDSPRAIQRLEMRVSELGRAIEATLSSRNAPREPDPAVARLENQMQDISARLEGLRDTGAHTAAIHTVEQRLEGRLSEIADRLGGLMNVTPQTIESTGQRLEGRIEEVATRLGTMFDNATKPQTAAIEMAQREIEGRLEDIVNRLGGMFDSAPQKAAIEHVHERLQAITDRIDTLNASQREPSAALDAIKSEIGALRQEVSERELPPAPNTDHLERQIRDLAAQLATVSESKDENKGLAELEAQIATLASDLELTKPRLAQIGQVEESLAKLQILLADSAQESIAGARAEARKAVSELSEMVAGNEIDANLVRGLMRDLDSLRNATGGSEKDTREKLESVSTTVSQVVDRLSKLEIDTTRAVAEAVSKRAAEPVAPPMVEPAKAAWTIAFKGAAEPVATPTETRKPPALAAVRDTAPVNLAEKKAADRRADFIAAARRAAQAVAEEAASMDSGPAEGSGSSERKPGAFARISQAIRNRKRPMLLAAAAIVLAIGAMQVYGKLATPVSKSALVAATTIEKPKPRVVVQLPPPATTQAGQSQLIAPPRTPDTAMAFAKPEAFENRFSPGALQAEPPTLPAPASDTTASTVAAPPAEVAAAAPPPAAEQPTDANPVVLASAEAGLQPIVSVAGLDGRLGSDKLLNAAGSGDPAAAFEIATRYAEGSRIPKDLAKAANWYTKAAEGGVAVAQYRLGSLYERGQGVPKDLTSAVNWYQRAADQGNVNAMHNLAVLMSEGADGAPDHDKALQWFLAAGNYGVRDSQYNLGVIYARGLGVAQDLQESYKWFAIAASQGDTDASARRDEVAKAMTADDLAKARASVAAWHVKPPLVEANGVAAPGGGWDGPGDTIGEADRQALVMKIQTLLAEAGYDPGPADGKVGPKTVDAVRAYQRKVGVPDTGQIDNTLVASLSDSPM